MSTNIEQDELVDRLESILREVKLRISSSQQLQSPPQPKRSPRTPPLVWPLEIIGLILDYLPQHHVYPFLSLSKGVNYIATRRLFRRVYVSQSKPIFHDANDDLLQWLFLTQKQFLQLLRIGYKWSGKIVILQSPPWPKSFLEKIRQHLNPVEVFVVQEIQYFYVDELNYFLQHTPLPDTQYPPFDACSSHLARLTLIGTRTYKSMSVKLKVDSLSVLSQVKGLDACIDLNSVKQLSLIEAYDKTVDNVYRYAHEFTSLEDLHIYQMRNNEYVPVSRFPGTIKRLVMNNPKWIKECADVYGQLLEYLEMNEHPQTLEWPRVLKRSLGNRLFRIDDIDRVKFPRLKLFVNGDYVGLIDRVLGEWLYTNEIN